MLIVMKNSYLIIKVNLKIMYFNCIALFQQPKVTLQNMIVMFFQNKAKQFQVRKLLKD